MGSECAGQRNLKKRNGVLMVIIPHFTMYFIDIYKKTSGNMYRPGFAAWCAVKPFTKEKLSSEIFPR